MYGMYSTQQAMKQLETGSTGLIWIREMIDYISNLFFSVLKRIDDDTIGYMNYYGHC